MHQLQKPFKIAAAQATPVFLEVERTVEKACDLIAQAAKHQAKLIVFPEVFLSGYPDWVWVVPNSKAAILNSLYAELLANAITIPDLHTRRLCQAARKAGIHVVMGMHERNAEASNASVYNTLLFIDARGEILGRHRKIIPTGGERLVWAQGEGRTLQVHETKIGKLAGLICWENYMPLARQALYNQGVQILAAPTWDKSDNWLLSMRHIAREGGMFVVSCCAALRMEDIPDRYEFKQFYPGNREWINTGRSCVINPKGEIIAGPVEAKEEIIYAEIDFGQIYAAKRMFDVAGHYARPDIFQLAVKKAEDVISIN
ncbi:MAG: carbon-nitrogen hydrolase family protein [Calditrichaeota bacterium]|nr:MAG: carbon-nitrogen hydrolase family protein [Calditrichota bacterium]